MCEDEDADEDANEDANENENENDFMTTPSGMVHFVGKTDRTGQDGMGWDGKGMGGRKSRKRQWKYRSVVSE